MGQGLRLVAAGVAAGTVMTWMLSGALAIVLAGVSPADPVAYAGATLSLVLVSLLALYLPARRECRHERGRRQRPLLCCIEYRIKRCQSA